MSLNQCILADELDGKQWIINKGRFASSCLDFSREGMKTESAQRDAFDFVLRQVRGKGKILSIHSRKAETAVLDGLKKYEIKPAIFHWFTGDLSSLQRIISEGYFLSINSAMLRSEKGRSHLRDLPHSQVLLETDGPFSKLASKPARPKDITVAAQQLAELWRIPAADVVNLTSDNFRRLLALSNADDKHE